MNTTLTHTGVLALTTAFALSAHAESATVSTVAELTNAIARSCTPITLKPGIYDLSTLEPCEVKVGSSTPLWTNMSVDDQGPAHIVFKKETQFIGENTKHWSEKTSEEETIIRGAGESDTMRLIYGYTGGGRGSTWRNITFEGGNATTYSGGAICIHDAHLTPDFSLSNCVFRSNRANIAGATQFMSARDCLFENNTALKGGAMQLHQTTAERPDLPWTNYLANCVFRGNVASGSGGGAIYAGPNFGTIDNCVFTNNSAINTGTGCGGALKLESNPNLVIRGCTFVDNRQTTNGGAVYGVDDLGGFSNCTFIGNHAKEGGAITCYGMLSSVDTCTVVSNSADTGRGSFYLKGYGRIANSTIAFNSTKGSNAGVYVTDFSKAGTVENCLFESNTNSPTVNAGSQLCGATNVVNCTFRGYGDMIAKNYDRCLFENCACDYDNWGGGMLFFDTRFEGGSFRNCLFVRNTAHNYICNASGGTVEIVNCTFADNLAKTAVNQGKVALKYENPYDEGYILYAFRGGDAGKTPDNKQLYFPSTNRVVNCIFANNTHKDGSRLDVTAYKTATSVAMPAQNLLTNCLYEDGIYKDATTVDPIVANPRFVAGDERYPDAPYYMPRRTSPARKAGVVEDWMTDATDIAGSSMLSDSETVDLGAYQCTLPARGLFLFLY